MIKSLLHFNNPYDLTKDYVKGVPWKVNGTVASSQDGKFINCLSLNGNGYLQNNFIDLSLDKEWTLDMWVNIETFSNSSAVSIATNDAYPHGIMFYDDFIFYGTGGKWEGIKLSSFVSVGTWMHFAFVNYLQSLIVFINGAKVTTLNHSNIDWLPNPEVLIGADRSVPRMFHGLIDEFRISDEALWTSDFTPPANEYHQAKYIYIDKNNTVMGMRE